MVEVKLLQRLRGSDSQVNGHADHGSRACPPPVAEARASAVSAAVDKIEGKRKPEDFIGHRKRAENLQPACRLPQYNHMVGKTSRLKRAGIL